MIKLILNSYLFARIKYLLFGNMECFISFFRKRGINIGNNCYIYSNICSAEPYLITIGNNVTVSTNVTFITHDNSICKVLPEFSILCGKINIGNNCFIGASSIILPGCSIGENCIIGSGSVVTKSFPDNTVIAGNPAKIISTIEKYCNKYQKYGLYTDGISEDMKRELITNSFYKFIQR